MLKPKSLYDDEVMSVLEFPSPLGDEVLKPYGYVEKIEPEIFSEFPSPLGDEVLKPLFCLLLPF